MKKRALVSFMKPPISSSYHLEGIRAALGILSGDEDHEVTVAYLGRGARCALKGVDRSFTKNMLELLKKSVTGGRFYVERESLVAEGISEKELGEDFAVVPRSEIRKRMTEADATLSF